MHEQRELSVGQNGFSRCNAVDNHQCDPCGFFGLRCDLTPVGRLSTMKWRSDRNDWTGAGLLHALLFANLGVARRANMDFDTRQLSKRLPEHSCWSGGNVLTRMVSLTVEPSE